MSTSLTQARLKSVLHYSPDTGLFTWKVTHPRSPIGAIAGATDAYGYVVVRIDGTLYKAHRLAWLYETGAWPKRSLDHINRRKNDNRICNLREVSQSQNMHNVSARINSKSGVAGVVWRADRKKWSAQIRIGYKMYRLGVFTDMSQAISARKAAEARLEKQFTR